MTIFPLAREPLEDKSQPWADLRVSHGTAYTAGHREGAHEHKVLVFC